MKRFPLLLSVLLILLVFSISAANASGNNISLEDQNGQGSPSLSQFNGQRIAVQTGTIFGPLIESKLPDAEVYYFNSIADVMTALDTGKVDAGCMDEPALRFLKIDYPQLVILDGFLEESNLAPVFPKTEAGQALCDQYNEFLEKAWADGTMQEIDDIWFGTDKERQTVLDYSSLPATNGILHMAADLSMVPFTYMKDKRIVGYDVDVAARFCQEYGYRLDVVPMDFGGILPSVQSGKCEFASSCITITEERAESVLFSMPNYYGGVAMAVKKDNDVIASLKTSGTGIATLNDLATARIGVQTGTTFDAIVLESYPDAVISYYNTFPDLVAAIEADKIDAFPGDEPVIRLIASENSSIGILDERMDSFDFGVALPKTEAGKKLQGEFNAWLTSIRESGELEELTKKWVEGPESEKTVPDYSAFPASKGVLTLATEGGYVPMCYYRDNEIVGLEIDMIARFCEANGYGLKLLPMMFDAILPAIQSGKADFASAGLTITEERKESVYFSDPFYTGGTVMAVLKSNLAAAQTGLPESEGPDSAIQKTSFRDGIVSSFNKTFIREKRWQLFLEGIGNTMLITLLSILFGTALGFLVFMLCRNGNPVANGVTRFSMWLVQGTPMVVLLMILYYIIFGSVSISGITVAVIGFTLTFGASVFGLIQMGVGTIDRGQYEAAYALGHSNRHTFFRIILPQAIPHVLPAYQGEIVGLIKATAIVGYIAVQDLTKMGDIVRSRTYEAFFPLIAVTIIYFVMEALFSFVIGRIRINIDPKKRKREKILKGVKVHD